jgi:uncharacterized membrane protein (UPF0127 family)
MSLPGIGFLLTAAAAVVIATVLIGLYLASFAPNGTFFSSFIGNAASFLTGTSSLGTTEGQYLKTTISIKNTTIIADLALTAEQQTRGLSGRDHLEENQGMLFVSKTPGRYGFWMPEMKFPLDIFWLDSNRSVIYIKENLQPCMTTFNCPTYVPDANSLYVLETVAGFAQKYKITKGTQFNFQLPPNA